MQSTVVLEGVHYKSAAGKLDFQYLRFKVYSDSREMEKRTFATLEDIADVASLLNF